MDLQMQSVSDAAASIGPATQIESAALNDTLPAPAVSPIDDRAADSGYVYALCQVDMRFRTLDVEKEFAQALGRTNTNGMTDRQALYETLIAPENRYLRRELCYVAQIQGLDTFVLLPRDSMDLDLLVEAVRPEPRADDTDVLIGDRGPLAPPQLCNGLTVPVVFITQLWTFSIGDLVNSIPRPDDVPEEDDASFRESARELTNRVMQLADNTGTLDEHRVVNYAVTRYAGVHHLVARQHARGYSLSGVDVRPSRLSGPRKILTVVLSFTERITDVREQYSFRADCTGKFVFLVSRLAPFFER